ncbi:hypothetical protein V6N13_108935 [Hibiscus sabdariffa]
MYSPREEEAMAWPSLDETKELIRKFHFISELQFSKKTMTVETYMEKKLSKVHNDLEKLNIKNKEAEAREFMLQMHHGKMLDDFNVHELEELIWFGETRRTTIRKRVGERERVAAMSMAWGNWFHNIMNPNEFRGGGSSVDGSSSVAAQLGLPGSSIGGSSIVVVVDLGLPGPSTGGSSSVVVADLRLSGPSLERSSRVVPNQGLPLFPTFSNPMFNASLTKGSYLGPFGVMIWGHDTTHWDE